MDAGLTVLLAVALAVVAVLLFLIPALRGRGRSHRPERTELYRRAAEALVEKNIPRAVDVLRRIALDYSDDWNAQLLLGDLLRTTGRAERALHLHQMLATQAPPEAPLRVRILESVGRDWLQLGHPERALRIAEEMQDTDRRSSAAAELVWRAQDAMGNWDEAWSALKRLDRRRADRGDQIPSLAAYRAYLGQKALQEDDPKAARGHLQSALRRDGGLDEAKVFLGDVRRQEGQENAAIELWKDFARRRPDQADLVFERLERTLFQLGRFGELNEIYEDLLREDVDHPGALAGLARMHLRRGLNDEADRYLRLLLEKHPGDRRGRRLLLGSLLAAGHTDEALRLTQDWLEGPESVEMQCAACGHRDRDLLLRCPQCGAWQPAAARG
ncbi:MAG: hypothetical protein GF355_16265 [Candidatus Eisenbacteria bacterium]|nr:hypothetical protein [Candidatus Eisenbacteria bacterium]